MNLNEAYATFLPWIEAEMAAVVAAPDPALARHYAIMQYHLGWLDGELRPARQPAGKRIRPVLCLLACAACGGDPQQAVPAAAGLELLHNFSLLHDDIEDDSPTRRHRPTAWTAFGLPQALNAGDAMFSLAYRAIMRLSSRGVPAATVLEVAGLVTDMCVALTEGQFLDMSFETRLDAGTADYFRMVAGKTAALLAAASQSGAVIAGAPAAAAALRRYGEAMGMAFQFQDDVLGIWGAESVTGKSAASDVISKKKSLPVVYALNSAEVGPALRRLYAGPAFTLADIPEVLALLDAAGARAYAEARVAEATADAHQALAAAAPALPPAAQAPLHELLDSLLARQA